MKFRTVVKNMSNAELTQLLEFHSNCIYYHVIAFALFNTLKYRPRTVTEALDKF